MKKALLSVIFLATICRFSFSKDWVMPAQESIKNSEYQITNLIDYKDKVIAEVQIGYEYKLNKFIKSNFYHYNPDKTDYRPKVLFTLDSLLSDNGILKSMFFDFKKNMQDLMFTILKSEIETMIEYEENDFDSLVEDVTSFFDNNMGEIRNITNVKFRKKYYLVNQDGSNTPVLDFDGREALDLEIRDGHIIYVMKDQFKVFVYYAPVQQANLISTEGWQVYDPDFRNNEFYEYFALCDGNEFAVIGTDYFEMNYLHGKINSELDYDEPKFTFLQNYDFFVNKNSLLEFKDGNLFAMTLHDGNRAGKLRIFGLKEKGFTLSSERFSVEKVVKQYINENKITNERVIDSLRRAKGLDNNYFEQMYGFFADIKKSRDGKIYLMESKDGEFIRSSIKYLESDNWRTVSGFSGKKSVSDFDLYGKFEYLNWNLPPLTFKSMGFGNNGELFLLAQRRLLKYDCEWGYVTPTLNFDWVYFSGLHVSGDNCWLLTDNHGMFRADLRKKEIIQIVLGPGN